MVAIQHGSQAWESVEIRVEDVAVVLKLNGQSLGYFCTAALNNATSPGFVD